MQDYQEGSGADGKPEGDVWANQKQFECEGDGGEVQNNRGRGGDALREAAAAITEKVSRWQA